MYWGVAVLRFGRADTGLGWFSWHHRAHCGTAFSVVVERCEVHVSSLRLNRMHLSGKLAKLLGLVRWAMLLPRSAQVATQPTANIRTGLCRLLGLQRCWCVAAGLQ